MRGHIDHVRVDGEMGEAATERKQGFVWVAIHTVLLNCMLHILSCERVLEFSRKRVSHSGRGQDQGYSGCADYSEAGVSR